MVDLLTHKIKMCLSLKKEPTFTRIFIYLGDHKQLASMPFAGLFHYTVNYP